MKLESVPLELKQSLCATCQYLGDAYIPVVDYRSYVQPKVIGFTDRYNGALTNNPARHCEHEKMKGRVTVYEFLKHTTVCQYYQKRNWERPATCGECERKYYTYPNGTFRCSGYPFTNNFVFKDQACINGKITIGTQLKMF